MGQSLTDRDAHPMARRDCQKTSPPAVNSVTYTTSMDIPSDPDQRIPQAFGPL